MKAEIHMLENMWNTTPIGNARAFRRSFIISFGESLHYILKKSRESAEKEALRNESVGVAIVLRDEKKLVEEAMETAFPNTKATKAVSIQQTGISAGRSTAHSFTGHMNEL